MSSAWLGIAAALCVCFASTRAAAQDAHASAANESASTSAANDRAKAPAAGDESATEPAIVEQRTARASEAFEAQPPVEPTNSTPIAPSAQASTRTLWDIVKILPVFFYSPETSVGFGAGTLFQFRMPGTKEDSRPSSVSLGAVYTLENQTVAQLTPDLRFGDDSYVLKLDLLGAKFPNRFYGMGNDPNADHFDKYTDCYVRGEADFRVRPFSRDSVLGSLYVGAHYASAWSDISNVRAGSAERPSLFDSIDDRGERPLFASGIGPSLAWDSRDGMNWPTRGAFVETKATAFEPWLGSDVRYRRLVVDARRYQRLWLDHVLAVRAVAQFVWGEVPFQRLPQLGGSSMFRGWFTGQLRGPGLMAVEAEYRMPLGPRWAVVAFGSVGKVGDKLRALSPKDLHVAGGGGVRFSVDKRDRMNIRLDLAYGDSFNPYLQFREAF